MTKTMKNLTAAAVLSTIGFCSPAKALASATELKGTWSIADRVCTDGKQPSDRFQMGQDTMIFKIAGNRFQIHDVISGQVFDQSGTVTADGHQLIMKDSDGKRVTALTTLSNKNELVLFVAGYEGQNGTCAQYQGLMLTLQPL